MNEKKGRGRPKGLTPPKRQYPVKLDEDTRGQLTAAAYWTRQSANSIIEEGLGIVLKRLQEAYNEGKPFSPKPDKALPADALAVPLDTAATKRQGAKRSGKGRTKEK